MRNLRRTDNLPGMLWSNVDEYFHPGRKFTTGTGMEIMNEFSHQLWENVTYILAGTL